MQWLRKRSAVGDRGTVAHFGQPLYCLLQRAGSSTEELASINHCIVGVTFAFSDNILTIQ